MTELTQLRARHHDVNIKIAELNGIDDLSEEQRNELDGLTGEYITLQTRMKAAELLEQEQKRSAPAAQDGSAREFAKLVDQASVGNILDARVNLRSTVGAEREIQQHFKVQDNVIPHAMLFGGGATQERALTVSGDASVNQAGAISGPYPSGEAAFAGVERVTVAPGTVAVPVVTVPAPGAAAAPQSTSGTTAVSATNQTLAMVNATPERHLSASIVFPQERRRLIPMLDEILRQNLVELLTAAADRDALIGGTVGLMTRGTAPTARTSADNYDDYVDSFTGQIDGNYARAFSDVRMLVGTRTLARASTRYRGNNSAVSATQLIRDLGSQLMATGYSPYVAGSSSNDPQTEQALVIRGNWPMSSVQHFWDELVVEDPYTDADTREVRLTMTQFTDFNVLRSGVYTRLVFTNSLRT